MSKKNLKVDFLHICDYANLDNSNKLIIIGVFQNINTKNFPSKLPSIYMVMGFSVSPEIGSEGEYDVEFIFCNEKEDFLKIPQKIKIGNNAKGNWIQRIIDYPIKNELPQKIKVMYQGEEIYSTYISINGAIPTF